MARTVTNYPIGWQWNQCSSSNVYATLIKSLTTDRSIETRFRCCASRAQEIGRSCTVKIDRAPKTSAPRRSYSVTKYGKGDETIENNWFSLSYAVRHERPRAENMAGQIRCWKDRPNKKVKVSLRYTWLVHRRAILWLPAKSPDYRYRERVTCSMLFRYRIIRSIPR